MHFLLSYRRISSPSGTLPFSLMEAMAAGKPVVATRVSGNKEIISHNETGLLVDGDNSIDLANTIERLMSDKALSETLEKGARGFVQTLSFEEMMRKYETFFQKVLAK